MSDDTRPIALRERKLSEVSMRGATSFIADMEAAREIADEELRHHRYVDAFMRVHAMGVESGAQHRAMSKADAAMRDARLIAAERKVRVLVEENARLRDRLGKVDR